LATAAIERRALTGVATFGVPVALAGLMTLLLVRLLPDVAGKPLHEDEAVAGLISARPLGDVLHTVVLDRGGAPLHFVLAHLALAIDATPDALRWLSIVFALATIPLCYDLGRRLAGQFAGLTAAALAATSQLLTIYGTFGRMYSLFAFASALAADLFVQALDRPNRRTALAAASASLLPLAVHPFGAFLFGAELVLAAWLWRGRNIRSALPVLGVALLALPLLLGDLRLSDRYAPEAGEDLGAGYSPGEAALRGLGGAAGGYGLVLGIFAVLALFGALTLARRRPAVLAFAALAIVAPPVALAIGAATDATSDRLGPRHLIFALPLWIGLVAAGTARVALLLPTRARIAVLVTVLVAAALTPSAVSDPRTVPTGEEDAVGAPAAWLREHVSSGDVLYPYSPLFLAALPEAAEARGYSREPVALARTMQRTGEVGTTFVSLPLPDGISVSAVRDLRRAGVDAHPFGSWLIIRDRGPFRSGRQALTSTAQMLEMASPHISGTPVAHAFLLQLRGTACAALDGEC
jgi:dolichyl-phosphate-mannose-protein mannosyltransferase